MAVNKIILNGEEIELSDEQARRIIGSGNLATVAQTLIGGVNELDSKVGDGILTTDNKALIGSVNEINEKINTIINDSGSSNSSGIDNLFTTNGSGTTSNQNTSVASGQTVSYSCPLNAPQGYKFFTMEIFCNAPFIITFKSYNLEKKTYDIKMTNIGSSNAYWCVSYLPIYIKENALTSSR